MVVHPLESGATHKRSLRSAIPSVAVHAAIVLVAVHATAHAALPTAPPPTVVDTRIFTPPLTTEPPRTSTTQGMHSRGSYVDALRSDDPLFTAAARSALLRTRFRPAESNGRRVRQLVQQSFSFVLR